MSAAIGGVTAAAKMIRGISTDDASDEPHLHHRYTRLCGLTSLRKWYSIFKQFDRNGDGDVDMRELGVIFRKLGQRPSDHQMKVFVHEVDADGSGSLDFEEFSLLMLRLKRATAAPAWLKGLFEQVEIELPSPRKSPRAAAADPESPPPQRSPQQEGTGKKRQPMPPPPAVVDLSFVKAGASEHVGFDAPLSEQQLHTTADSLAMASNLHDLRLSGYGGLCGAFFAEELSTILRRMHDDPDIVLRKLSLAHDELGDAGAKALANLIGATKNNAPYVGECCLTELDLSGNGITEEGARALLDALEVQAGVRKGMRLRRLCLDENPLIPEDLLAEIQSRVASLALALNLEEQLLEQAQLLPEPPPPTEEEKLLQLMRSRAKKLVSLFEKWDRDDDGKVSKLELRKACKSLDFAFGKQTIDALFDQFDPDGSGKMTMGEMRQMLRPPKVLPLNVPTAVRSGDLSLDQVWAKANGFSVSDAPPEAPNAPALAALGFAGLRAQTAAPVELDAPFLVIDGSEGGELSWLSPEHAAQLAELTAKRYTETAEALFDPHLEASSLQLQHCRRFGDAGAVALLRECPNEFPPLDRLFVLRLTDCALTDGCLRELSHALAQGALSELTALALDRNAIELAASGPQGGVAEILGARMASHPKLREVALDHNPIGDEHGAAFCKALLGHTNSLLALSLGRTKVGDATAAACAEALSVRAEASALVSLLLSSRVGDAGATALANALRSGISLRQLWLGDAVGDKGGCALAAAVQFAAQAGSDISPNFNMLALGGEARGGVRLSNHLGDASVKAMIAANNASENLSHLLLSNNAQMSGAACIELVSALKSCGSLRTLHLDGCGLGASEAEGLLEAMGEVWCLHDLKVSVPLSLKQRMSLSSLLAANKRLGIQRVYAWRSSKRLDAVAWVFQSLCQHIPTLAVEGGLNEWQGSDCAQFVRNCGLPQYASCFEANLNGPRLKRLQLSMLAQLGLSDWEHQKQVMQAVRHLLNAYEVQARVRQADANWQMIAHRNDPASQQPASPSLNRRQISTSQRIERASSYAGFLPQLKKAVPPSKARRERQAEEAASSPRAAHLQQQRAKTLPTIPTKSLAGRAAEKVLTGRHRPPAPSEAPSEGRGPSEKRRGASRARLPAPEGAEAQPGQDAAAPAAPAALPQVRPRRDWVSFLLS